MTMRITMREPARSEDGASMLLKGSTYTVTVPFGRQLVQQGFATDTDAKIAPPGRPRQLRGVVADLTINEENAQEYNGALLEVTTALSITLSAGLPLGFSIIVIPPASGVVSIVSAGGVLLNGMTTTITRSIVDNTTFAILQRATDANSYVVTGQAA